MNTPVVSQENVCVYTLTNTHFRTGRAAGSPAAAPAAPAAGADWSHRCLRGRGSTARGLLGLTVCCASQGVGALAAVIGAVHVVLSLATRHCQNGLVTNGDHHCRRYSARCARGRFFYSDHCRAGHPETLVSPYPAPDLRTYARRARVCWCTCVVCWWCAGVRACPQICIHVREQEAGMERGSTARNGARKHGAPGVPLRAGILPGPALRRDLLPSVSSAVFTAPVSELPDKKLRCCVYASLLGAALLSAGLQTGISGRHFRIPADSQVESRRVDRRRRAVLGGRHAQAGSQSSSPEYRRVATRPAMSKAVLKAFGRPERP